MPQKPIRKLLEEIFPKSDKDLWKKMASAEMDGKDPFIDLLWNGPDKLTFAPYYDKKDIDALILSDKFVLPPATASFLGNRTWFNLPRVAVKDNKLANKIALDHLANGADGILFDFQNEKAELSENLLQGIEAKYCALSFAGINTSLVENFCESLRTIFAEAQLSEGFLLHQALPPRCINLGDQYRSCGILVSGETPVQQIHDALVKGTHFLNRCVDEDDAQMVLRNILFSMTVSADFLIEIAKFKALRILWYQVVRSFDLSYEPSQLHIHAVSNPWINEKYQPHGNMLKATTAAIAAISGGCGSITIIPEDESNTTMNRIARNVSNILREESHLDKVSDPLAGAYGIEVMVEKMASTSWSMFQQTMTNYAQA